MDLRIVPATPETWPAVATVMETPGDPEVCWCQIFRMPREQWEDRSTEQNRADLERLVSDARVPGLVAYDGDEPVAWCSVAPLEQLTRILASPFFAEARPDGDDLEGRWAVTCFVVREQARGAGMLPRLLRAAVEHAREQGATGLEGYPLDPAKAESLGPDELYAGTVRHFEDQGFARVAPLGPRVLMFLSF
jgi:GNAT superfamily N-acetyltransferase